MSGSLRVFVTGFRPSIRELCDALAQQPAVELAGAVGYVGEAARAFRDGEVDVVVHALPAGTRPQHDLARIRAYTRVPIVLLAEAADAALLEEALDGGVADVVVLPQPAERLAFAVRKAAMTSAANLAVVDDGRARVITTFSPKGGSGKTVVSANLAATVAKRGGLRTLLLDLDLQFGDAAIMLGVDPEQTLHELVTAPGLLDAEKFAGYVTPHPPSGLDVLAAPLRPEDGEAVAEHKVERLLEVARSIYDVIVVDTSPSFHGPMLAMLDRTDVLLVLCTPEVPTLKNVRLGIETLRRLAFPDESMKLVLNRSDASLGIRRPEVEEVLAMPVSHELPSSPDVPAAVNKGTPLALAAPAAPYSRAVREMADALLAFERSKKAWSNAYSVGTSRAGLVDAMRGLAVGWLPSRGSTAEGSA
jgi:pilus assembly protein CpaE